LSLNAIEKGPLESKVRKRYIEESVSDGVQVRTINIMSGRQDSKTCTRL